MSYDLSVYAAAPLSFDDLIALVRGTIGLDVDGSPSSDTESLMVVRGRRRAYCFTVDGPFEVKPDDVPEEVTAAALEINSVYQVLVEGSAEASIPHAARFARKLAKATHGVMFDEQTEDVWPKPKQRRVSVPAERRKVDMVTVSFFMLNDDRPADLPGIYLRTAREFFPDMFPVNFDDRKFVSECVKAGTGSVLVQVGYPLVDVFYRPLDRQKQFSFMSLDFDKAGLVDHTARQSLKAFFVEFAKASHSSFASAEVRRGSIWESGAYYETGDSERSPDPSDRGTWAGLHAYPQWWTWFGPEYSELVSPYLGGNGESYGDSVFHAWAEEPLNRDEISAVLPDTSRPWLPDDYTYGTDQFGIINKYAKIIPPRFQ